MASFISSNQLGWNGKFYEQCLQGNLFSFGAVSTALIAANATATGLTSTAKPIIGIYNPINSNKNLVILKSIVLITAVASSSSSPGAFVWVSATLQTGISGGSAPINRFLGASNPSVAQAFAMGTALTGLSGSLTNTNIPFNGTQVVAAEPATSTAMMGGQSEESNSGDWIVPPGGFLGIMGTASTTTVSCASKMLWAEVPLTGV